MKNQILAGLICLNMFAVFSVLAEENKGNQNDSKQTESKSVLYKTVDANGNVTYSDKPSSNAKEIPMSKGQSINLKPPKVTFYSPNETSKQDSNSQANGYSEAVIVSPKNDDVLRNNGAVATFEINTKPELAATDYIIFFIDGAQVNATITGNSIIVNDVEYGAHRASFSIMSNKNKLRIKSAGIKFNLLHTVRKKVGQNGQPNTGVLTAAQLKIKLPEHPKPADYQQLRKREY